MNMCNDPSVIARRFSRRLLALMCAPLLLLASSAQAGTVLGFAQSNPADIVTVTESGGVTTIASTGNADGGGVSIPVLASSFNGIPFPLGLPMFETITATSVGTATTSSGTITQIFSGTVAFTAGEGSTGSNFLTATFTDAVFSGAAGGHSASLNATAPGLTFTSDQAVPPFGPITGMSLSFSNIPALAITGGSVGSFVAQNAGTFSAAVPEPSALCLASLAVVIGTVTAYGKKRMKNELAN